MIYINYIPTRGDISSGEVFKHYTGQGPNIESIHLDQVPWLSDHIVFRLPHSIGSLKRSPMSRDTISIGLL